MQARNNNRNSRPLDEYEAPFGSNSIRLSGWEWAIAATVCLVLFSTAPRFWTSVEKFEPESDYRLPYLLSSDYWLYNRYCRWAGLRFDTLVVGDSVVWGHYVPRNATLSHYLNQCAGRDQFANLGVDGTHPVALAGLLRYYGRDISGKNVILHLNPLWMSDKKQDLQTEKEYRFNHPELVPQFTPTIPCYKERYAMRISIAAARHVAFLGWTSHLRTAYFQNMDLPTWTLEYPYENPLKALTREFPVSDSDNPEEHASWTQRGTATRDFDWVEPATSLQWSFFRQTVELLKARKNTVFVLVGPFNEHMLKEESLKVYREIKNAFETWFRQNDIAHYMPEPLPSELYHDASHPSAEGYAMLAKQLFDDPSFQSTVLRANIDPPSTDIAEGRAPAQRVSPDLSFAMRKSATD